MNVLIVYCHPSKNSFTHEVKEEFIRGLSSAGNTFEISDLYQMNFNETLSEKEYLREGFYDKSQPIDNDVLSEQKKIQNADAMVFIYPTFWTEAPAKLVGWFQRVWTYGFAYGEPSQMKQLDKAIFLVTFGGSSKDPVRKDQIEAMKTVMIGDRIHQRAKKSKMVIFDEMTRGYGNDENRTNRCERFLRQAFEIGQKIDML